MRSQFSDDDGGLLGVADGFVGVADGLLVTGGLVVVTGAEADSDDVDCDEAGVVCVLTISPGCVEVHGAVLKVNVGLAEMKSEPRL